MLEAVRLYGTLLLALLGVVVPLFSILLSVFREGSVKLSNQYEAERAETEKKIREQVQKDTRIEEIKIALRKLEKNKRMAMARLAYLDPKEQVARLLVPLLLAFVATAIYLAINDIATPVSKFLLLSVSLLTLGYGARVFMKLLSVLVEVISKVEDKKNDESQRTIQLLTSIVEAVQKSTDIFLEKVYVVVDDQIIKTAGQEISMKADAKREFRMAIVNYDDRLAKNVEIGLIFPKQGFLVEKPPFGSLYTSENGDQIVRFEGGLIHGNTTFLRGGLSITPLKRGEYEITSWVKGENIKAIHRNLKVIVT